MSMKRGESFDLYSGVGTGAFPLSLLYTTNIETVSGLITAAPSLIAGRFGGQALRIGYNGSGVGGVFMHRALESPLSALAHEFSFRRNQYNMVSTGAGVPIYRLRSGLDIAMVMGVDFHGELLFGTTNLTSGLLYRTSGLGLARDIWRTLGYELLIADGTGGRLLVRVDGEVVDEVPGIDTKALTSATVNGYEYITYTLDGPSTVLCDFDDAYWCESDELPPDVYKAEQMRPMLDAGPNQWTPSSGSDHYAMVDDTTPDGDTTRLTSATPGNKDRFGLTDLSSNPREIHALQAVTVGRKTDAGLTQMRTNFVSGAAIDDGDTQTLGLNYGVEFDLITNDPDSGTALDGFEVNAMQVEIEHLV